MLKDRSNWILLILIFIILFASFLLYENLMKRGKEGNNPVIGILTFKNKTVERKFDSEVIWDSVDSGIEIRNKDTIRSGDFSDAVLILNDKTKISINENSMIYLDFTDGMNLNFAYGSMSLDKTTGTGETLKIVSGDKTVEVKETNLVMEKKNKEELNFQVKKGDAKVKSGTEEKVLKTNEKATLSENKIEIEKVFIELQSPDEYFVATSREDSIPVNFKWALSGKLNKVQVELAFDSKFRKIIKSYQTNSQSATVSVKSGNYYWRVSGIHPEKKEMISSSFRKFRAVSLVSPAFISPKNGKKFTYTNLPPIVQFSWTKIEDVKYFRLELSDTNEFGTILKTITTNHSYASIDNLKPGTYFARVVSELNIEGGNLETSNIISFSIQEALEPPIPQLVSPNNQQSLNKIAFAKGKYYFQWKDSSEYQSYNIEIASDSSFSNIIKKEITTTNLFKPNFPLEVGEYYWRVAGIREGKIGKNSKEFRFEIKFQEKLELKSPPKDSKFDIEENEISFQWGKVDIDPKFILEISGDSSFSNVLQTRQTSNYFEKIHLKKAGNYFWRVKALDENGKTLLTSAIFDFEIIELSNPELVFPNEGQKVDMAKKDNLEFKWKVDSTVNYYEFELMNENKGVIIKTKTKLGRYNFTDLTKLDEGQFYWTVQAFAKSKSGKVLESEKVKSEFKIFLSEKPLAPAVKSSKKIYVE